MGQESFKYSFVARGKVVLAEFTESTGNDPAIAIECLQKLPSSMNNMFTYRCDNQFFNFLFEDGYAYCVVAKESVGKQISVAFLECVKADFKKRYGGGTADGAVSKSLDEEFGPVMKEHMQYIIDHADEVEKPLKVKSQDSEIEAILSGGNLCTFSVQREPVQKFREKVTLIRWKMWYRKMKIKLVVIGILLLVLIPWISICHGYF